MSWLPLAPPVPVYMPWRTPFKNHLKIILQINREFDVILKLRDPVRVAIPVIDKLEIVSLWVESEYCVIVSVVDPISNTVVLQLRFDAGVGGLTTTLSLNSDPRQGTTVQFLNLPDNVQRVIIGILCYLNNMVWCGI